MFRVTLKNWITDMKCFFSEICPNKIEFNGFPHSVLQNIIHMFSYTVYPRNLDSFYVVTYYIKWVKTS